MIRRPAGVTAGACASAAQRFEPRGVFASGSRIGIDDQFAPLPVDYQPVAGSDLPHAPGNADQRRDALVPGDDRDMARHASVRRHQSGDPAEIHLCRIRRRQLVGHHDRPRSQPGKGIVGGFARQDAADTRTYVPHIVGTSAQVVVVERREHAAHLFAGFSERLLGGQVLFRNPPLDQPGEHRVAGHLQMGGENSLPFRQCGQLRLRTLQRRMEPPGLGHGVACRGRSSGGYGPHGGGFVAALGADFHFGAVFEPQCQERKNAHGTGLPGRGAQGDPGGRKPPD